MQREWKPYLFKPAGRGKETARIDGEFTLIVQKLDGGRWQYQVLDAGRVICQGTAAKKAEAEAAVYGALLSRETCLNPKTRKIIDEISTWSEFTAS